LPVVHAKFSFTMHMPLDKCGLCLKVDKLQNSHLFPAALYKRLRQSDLGSDSNPVVVTKRSSITTSRQISSKFLCEACEQRFTRNGENYVLAQCALPDGTFDLRDKLRKSSPIESMEPLSIYDVQALLGDAVEHYVYFAASIFWRASAHVWKISGQQVGSICLGERYQEEFRLYLTGEAEFPANARIFLHVSSEETPDQATVAPCTFRIEKVHRHKFYIPGLLFILFLGSDVSKRFDNLALNGSRKKIMWQCPFRRDSLFEGFHTLIKGSTPLGKLRRWKPSRQREGL
jgi:hypothetical protein